MSLRPVIGQETKATTPAQLCAKYDRGGGTGLPGTFGIYSIAALPATWEKQLQTQTELSSGLEQAAAVVATKIPVYFKLNDINENELSSLPSSSRPSSLSPIQIPRLPWFLLNAAVAKQRCIVGQNSVVETLLVILRRPWCILEVCCCDFETVSAVLDFAILARQLDSKVYSAAVLLLSHEKQKRNSSREEEERVAFTALSVGLGSSQPDLAPVREIFAVLSVDGMKSHNPFWLRVVCVCAMELGITFSGLLRMLDASKALAIPKSTGSPVRCSTPIPRGPWSNDDSLAQQVLSDSGALDEFQIQNRRLVALYQQVLRKITEDLAL